MSSGPTTVVTRVAVGSGLVALAMTLPLLRPTGHVWRTVFAEDGAIYFQQAHDHGVFSVMFRGYAGYLQLPPRVLGGLATLAPVHQLPVWLAVEATAMCGLLAGFAYWATRDLVEPTMVRIAVAGLVVLMPAMGYENTATITNTIWSFLAVAPLAFLATGDRPREVTLRATVAFLAATSSALALLYLPLAIGVIAWRRSRDTAIVSAVFAAGLMIQLAVVLHTHNDTGTVHRSLPRLVDLLGIRNFAEYLIGEKGINASWAAALLLAVFAPLIVTSILILLLIHADRLRALATAVACYSVLVFVVPVWGRGTNAVPLTASEPGLAFVGRTLGVAHGSRYISSALRYSVVPVFLLAVAIAIAASSARGAVGRVARALFVTHVAILAVVGFSVTGPRSARLNWSTAVATAYRAHCGHRNPKTRVAVQTEPGPFTEYPIVLQCRELKP